MKAMILSMWGHLQYTQGNYGGGAESGCLRAVLTLIVCDCKNHDFGQFFNNSRVFFNALESRTQCVELHQNIWNMGENKLL